MNNAWSPCRLSSTPGDVVPPQIMVSAVTPTEVINQICSVKSPV